MPLLVRLLGTQLLTVGIDLRWLMPSRGTRGSGLSCITRFCLTLPSAGVVYRARRPRNLPDRSLDWVPPKKVTSCIEEADMWRRQKALTRLHDELNTLAVFDRVYDYTQDHDLADSRAHELRQMRRSQIMAEIKELSTSTLQYRNRTRISSAIILLIVGGFATLHFLLK